MPKSDAKPKTTAAPPAAEGFPNPDPKALAANLMEVGAKSHQLLADFLKRQVEKPGHNPGPLDPMNIANAFIDLTVRLMHDPRRVLEAQSRLWSDYFKLWSNAAKRLAGEEVEPVIEAKGDKRFKDPSWHENQIFDFIKQSYLLTARWMQDTVRDVDGLDDAERKKIAFFTKQFVDAISPSNFVLTNPEVLRETLKTNGDNLVRGLQHVIEDLERGGGKLAIRQTDDSKFTIGENVATAPGKVVFQNDLMQLLQFDPTTEQVYERPLLIVPPWINKFYILDLKPENSFIRWATGKGYTVFVVSWVNPSPELAEKSFESYMYEGPYAALDAIEKAIGVKEVNAIGYCIGGTLMASTLAHMAAKKDARIKSITFFAAQVDFTEAGELQVFIDEEQLKSMESQMRAEGGVLPGQTMATTFNMLRSNDLIWSFVVNNYLMGRDPLPFDLLFWNSDATRMPIAMHMFYLRECYKENKLARGEMELGGVKLDLRKVKVPAFLQASKDDHIAPARSVFKTTKLWGGPVEFMVAGSGHIAGVINPPSAKKYQHWTNADRPETIEEWWTGAIEHPGSWWDHWDAWLAPKSGKKVKARVPGEGGLPALEDAPGSYVKMK